MPQPLEHQGVAASSFPVTAVGQRADCSNCRSESLRGTAIDHVVEAWPSLPSHIRETILTLVAASHQSLNS